MLSFKYLFCAKIHRSFQNTKYFQVNLQKAYIFIDFQGFTRILATL